jgi:uncharacterized membrane protein
MRNLSLCSLTVLIFGILTLGGHAAVVLDSGQTVSFDFNSTPSATFTVASGSNQALLVAIGMETGTADFSTGTWSVTGQADQTLSLVEGLNGRTGGAVYYLLSPHVGEGTITLAGAGGGTVEGRIITATGVASLATASAAAGANNEAGTDTLDFNSVLPEGSAVVLGGNINGGTDPPALDVTSGSASFSTTGGLSANGGSNNFYSTATNVSGDLIIDVAGDNRFARGGVALTPVPEPSAVTLLGLVGLSLLALRRRR